MANGKIYRKYTRKQIRELKKERIKKNGDKSFYILNLGTLTQMRYLEFSD